MTDKKKKNKNSRLVEGCLKAEFPDVEAYQYNSVSIRVRIVDERFSDLSRTERYDWVAPKLKSLSEEIQADITILLLLSPDEVEQSMTNVEFEHPSPSML